MSENAKITKALQVTYNMSSDETKKRELKGVVNACNAFGLSKATVVTYESEEIMTHEGIEIELVPFFKWCLSRC